MARPRGAHVNTPLARQDALTRIDSVPQFNRFFHVHAMTFPTSSNVRRVFASALCATFFAASFAGAADLGLSVDAGTTGIGGHLTVPVLSSVNLRVGANDLSHSFGRQVNRVDYDFGATLRTVDLLADWYVFPTSKFRVTAGAVYNASKIDALALTDSNGNYRISGRTYSGALVGKVFGKVDFRKTAPYLGIGWGNAIGPGDKWRFTADLGATFQGRPGVSLANSGCTAGVVACGMLASGVAAQQASLADDLDSFRVYPVLRIGVSYQF